MSKLIAVPGYEGPERRNGGTEHLVTVYARAVAVVGIPGVITIFLVWMGAQELPKITQQTTANYAEILSSREQTRQLIGQLDEQLRLMRWICAGVSKTDADRRNCFEK